MPQPKLLFDNGLDRLTFTAHAKATRTETVSERMEAIKKAHPRMEVPAIPPRPPRPEPPNQKHEVVIYADPYPDDKPRPRDVEKYNQVIDSFYEDYEQYLVELDKATELNSRKLELKIQLNNSGTAPVEDAVIFMCIPGQLQLARSEKIFEYPQKPEAPELPQPRHHSSRNWYEPQIPTIAPPYYPRPNTYVEPPNIERNNFSHHEDCYRVSFKVRQATHRLIYNCPYDMYIVFDSLEEARSFKIEYQIIAANITNSVDGALHVIVKSTDKEDIAASTPTPGTSPEMVKEE